MFLCAFMYALLCFHFNVGDCFWLHLVSESVITMLCLSVCVCVCVCSHILDVVIPSDSVSHTKEVIYASSCPHLSSLTVRVLCTRPQTLSVYTSACAHRAIYDYTPQHV